MVTPSWMVVQHFIPYNYTNESFWSSIWIEATFNSLILTKCLEGLGGWPNTYRSRGYSPYTQENLVMAQNCMKQQANQGRSERQFAEGDQVFLRLQPYKQTSLKVEHCQKLAPKFYSPYTMLKCGGQVSYQLAFSIHSKLHPVFHVSCLKKVIGTKCQIQTNLP